MFRHSFAYMVNSLSVLLDVTVMINILKESVKTVHEKMLKAINL